MFIVTGGVCATGLAVAVAELVVGRRKNAVTQINVGDGSDRQASVHHSPLTEGEMLRNVMQKLGIKHNPHRHMTEGEMLREITHKLDGNALEQQLSMVQELQTKQTSIMG